MLNLDSLYFSKSLLKTKFFIQKVQWVPEKNKYQKRTFTCGRRRATFKKLLCLGILEQIGLSKKNDEIIIKPGMNYSAVYRKLYDVGKIQELISKSGAAIGKLLADLQFYVNGERTRNDFGLCPITKRI